MTRNRNIPIRELEHESPVQLGYYAGVVFAQNPDTEMFWDEMFFPALVDDSYTVLSMFQDAVDNARYFGEWNEDEDHFWFGFKSGKTEYVGDGTDYSKIRKNLYTEKNLTFAVVDGSFGCYFWVNGWDGIYALQKITNWFDIQNMKELESDWI